MDFIRTFDHQVTRALQSVPLPGFGELMSTATFLGNASTLLPIAGVVALIALLRGAYPVAGALVASMALDGLYNAIKLVFHRARPDTIYAEHLNTSSFPSGHAAGSLAIYGLLGYLLFTRLPRPLNYIGLLVGLVLPFLIGISRAYLGAHYPTDVIGGWVFAAIGLVVVIKLFRL